MEQEYDVLVIGGCTAGLYFAATMAEKGYRTLVAERDGTREHGNRYDIFHLAKSSLERFGLDVPKAGDKSYVHSFSRCLSYSAFDNHRKVSAKEEILVLHRHSFMRAMEQWAEERGTEVLHNAQFLSPLFDSAGRLSGASLEIGGEVRSVFARLVVDASGIASAVRTSLPPDYGVENFEIGPRDKFFVILYYAELETPEIDRVRESRGWPYYKTWEAPQHDPDGAIYGVGASLSYQYAQECYARFTDTVQLPRHRVTHVEKGCTPYRRPPYSFVADGFIVLGDAACLTNPWNGEGITAAWLHVRIAADAAEVAMKDGSYPTMESLWSINKKYNSDQGAEFARILPMLPAVMDCTPSENDYEFKKSIVFENDGIERQGSVFGKIIKGIITGNLRMAILINFITAAVLSRKIAYHYRRYPDSPRDLVVWVRKANRLWNRARTMADLVEQDLRD